MRAFVIVLLLVAAPIYFGGALLGNSFGVGGDTSFRDIRDQVAASDLARDAIAEARDYAATHPALVDSVKAHRAEIDEFRSRLCATVQC
ncbi:MAG TPA: hypothetical protein VGP48_08490 [Stellaceae bacterium]|nr:hypothetical protein [Stellaceae bacterium]